MILSILKEVGKAILLAILSEAFLKELIVYVLEWLSKKTDNEVDDKIVEMVKKALEKPEDKAEEKK